MAAVEKLRPIFRETAGIELPAAVRVSVGWPAPGMKQGTIGVCHSAAASSDGTPEIFVSPVLDDPENVLATLTHELIHAWDDCKSGHRGEFAKTAKAVGLTGQMTSTVAGDKLKERFVEVAATLGPYPHAKISSGGRKPTGKGRMVKVACSDGARCNDYSFYTTNKWVESFVLRCPICQAPAHPAHSAE